MKAIVQSQRDNGIDVFPTVTHYIGEVHTPISTSWEELALYFWPNILTDEQEENFESLVQEHFIENVYKAFYMLDIDDEGYNVHTWVKFVEDEADHYQPLTRNY